MYVMDSEIDVLGDFVLNNEDLCHRRQRNSFFKGVSYRGRVRGINFNLIDIPVKTWGGYVRQLISGDVLYNDGYVIVKKLRSTSMYLVTDDPCMTNLYRYTCLDIHTIMRYNSVTDDIEVAMNVADIDSSNRLRMYARDRKLDY